MTSLSRNEKLSWLKVNDEIDESEDKRNRRNECRLLTNVRCLSEGVDVPSLDAVLFLSERSSEIDIVQSVGRVMRLSKDKKYGYIIIPVIIANKDNVDEILKDNKTYKVIWNVLTALRSHDDRFDVTINQIKYGTTKPLNIMIGRPSIYPQQDIDESIDAFKALEDKAERKFKELERAIYATIVDKVGERTNYVEWASNTAEAVQDRINKINILLDEGTHTEEFTDFLTSLKSNINEGISKEDAIEMLAQHIVTEPIFNALFGGTAFVDNNPVSKSLQRIINLLSEKLKNENTARLENLYRSITNKVKGVDDASARQSVIIELYDKFFNDAFPKLQKLLGIVYTPIEAVDFMIRSVEDILQAEFSKSISDYGVHVLDPFTGTGTFIARLLSSKLIKKEDLERKYKYELHANEMVLLAYYIAAVNIENIYQDFQQEQKDYEPFNGICLTDTFKLGRDKGWGEVSTDNLPLEADGLRENHERLNKQQETKLRIIISNPPYSVGQKNANINAPNIKYPAIENRIKETYVKLSTTTNKGALYDAYFKAFRWSSDRLGEDGGIIYFISNGGYSSSKNEGFRKSIVEEFSSIYIINLRGNINNSMSAMDKKIEGGNIFGQK